LEPPTDAEFAEVMNANVLGAMRVLPSLAEALAPDARLAVLSSRMGAIGPRTGHQGWLYRASKAALNSVLKDVSQVLAGRCTCVSLHPGWVRTDMGGTEADLAPEQSAADLRRVIAVLVPADNGRFFDHDGSAIDW
jgi:NAD(P)-dependent dehydrogenase (short-subunit alcohol dehydrogenase family)